MDVGVVFLWLALMVVLLVFEGLTTGLYTIWFAIGAMVAAICAAMNFDGYIQIVVFLFVSTLLLLLLRPIVKSHFASKKSATNADRVMEKIGVVTEEIDNTHGQGAIYIDGKTWSARSYNGDPIPMDTHVSVDMIDGVKLIVTPVRLEAPVNL